MQAPAYRQVDTYLSVHPEERDAIATQYVQQFFGVNPSKSASFNAMAPESLCSPLTTSEQEGTRMHGLENITQELPESVQAFLFERGLSMVRTDDQYSFIDAED